jgi:hypothetical protein
MFIFDFLIIVIILILNDFNFIKSIFIKFEFTEETGLYLNVLIC